MAERQRMRRHVDFVDNLHSLRRSPTLQLGKLALGVMPVTRRKPRVGVALQAERGVGLVPVVAEVLLEPVVVQVQVQDVHLVVGHHPHQVAQVGEGDELSPAVQHQPPHGIVGFVAHLAPWQPSAARLHHLQQRARPPAEAGGIASPHRHAVGYVDGILLRVIHPAVGQQLHVAAPRPALDDSRARPRHRRPAVGHRLRGIVQRVVAVGYPHPAVGDEVAVAPFPFLHLGDNKRFGILRRRPVAMSSAPSATASLSNRGLSIFL